MWIACRLNWHADDSLTYRPRVAACETEQKSQNQFTIYIPLICRYFSARCILLFIPFHPAVSHYCYQESLQMSILKTLTIISFLRLVFSVRLIDMPTCSDYYGSPQGNACNDLLFGRSSELFSGRRFPKTIFAFSLPGIPMPPGLYTPSQWQNRMILPVTWQEGMAVLLSALYEKTG